MHAWKSYWQRGVAPLLSTRALSSLQDALSRDDPALMQNGTTRPAASPATWDEPVQCACALGWCAWQGEGLTTVGAVEDYFQRLCASGDERVGERAACRFFFNWFDETPRQVMRHQLLAEVRRTLSQRARLPGKVAS